MQPVPRGKTPFTYAEYAALPDDGRRWELIDGELEVNPAPSSRHQTVSRRLQFELMKALEEPGTAQVFNAPLDLILGETTVLQPDLALVKSARSHLISERGIEGPPDVVVEILSPATRVMDQRVKKLTYERFRVQEYWLVDPLAGEVELFSLTESGYVLTSRLDRSSRLTSPSFAELEVDLARVFR